MEHKNNEQDKIETIFSNDEMALLKIDPGWNREQLLAQEGIFYLKDVAKKLRLSSVQLKQRAQRLTDSGQSPWKEMGIQRVWTHWMLRMKVFAPYLKDAVQTIREVQPHWDGNLLLKQKGVFYLVDSCGLIPFTPNQIRYHAHRNPNSREDFGVWKDEHLNTFLVDMEVFSLWIRDLWLKGFNQPRP